MLSQGELPNDRPVAFFSKNLNDIQKRYSTIEKELLAIVESIKFFRVYLYGRFFVLITDHKALSYLFNMKDCGSRLFRQKIELSNYNFKILYRPGAQNKVADALSRMEPVPIEQILANEETNCFAITRSKTNANIQNPTIPLQNSPNTQHSPPLEPFVTEHDGTILNKRSFDLIFHLVPIESDELKNGLINKSGIIRFTQDWSMHRKIHHSRIISNQFSNSQNVNDTIECIKNILKYSLDNSAKNIAINIDYNNIKHYFFFKKSIEEIFSNKNITKALYLNKILELSERDDINKILDLYHGSLLGGHVGSDKMFKTISKFYKWKNMFQDIKSYTHNCTICEETKITTHTRIPMEISSLGDTLFDHTYIDFVGPIPQSCDGHKYIFTGICDLTKFLIAVPTTDCTALTAAECILEHILCRYNFPSKLISDNATTFVSHVIKELCTLFQMKKIFATPYHPQSNIVERSHRTLNSFLREFTNKNRDNWHDLLTYATFTYNNTTHTTTGFTPHKLAHGFKIKISTHLTKPKTIYNYDNLADLIKNNISKTLELASTYTREKSKTKNITTEKSIACK